MKKIYAVFQICFASVAISILSIGSLQAQTPEFYNNFGGTSTNSFPLNTTTSNKVQWIYAPGTLNSNGPTGSPAYPGLITHVFFRLNTANPSSVYSDFTISLGQNLGSSTMFSTTGGAFNFITGLTECFYAASYSLTGATSGSWYGVELQTPFLYDPNLSLIFEMKVSSGTGNSVGQVSVTGENMRIWGGYAATGGTTGTGLVDFGINLSYLPVPNNAGLTELPSISNGFCADTIPVTAKIVNFGNNVIDSVFVDWTVNNVTQTGQWHTIGLDTFGSGNNDTIITIGSYVFQTGNLYDVKAWTTMPNNQNDTVNGNDTTMVSVGPALAGTYQVGPSTSADYADLTEAVAALNTLGVCDHVVFNIESGTYSEAVTINQILGAGPDRTVTFQSLTGDSSDVIVSFDASALISLNNADWVRIHAMTFQNTSASYDIGIEFTSGSDSLIVSNCHFIGNYNTTTSSNASLIRSSSANDIGAYIHNNLFENSGYGVYLYGSSTTGLEDGLRLENNRFINQYYQGARIYYHNAPTVRNNYVSSNSTYSSGYGLYMYYCDNAMEASGNHVVSATGSTWPTYGMYFGACDGAGLNNTGRIFNNRVVLGADTTSSSSTTFYGMYLTSTNAQRVVNNTVTIMAGGTSARALYQTSSDLIFFKNNLWSNHSGGYAAYFNSGISIEVDRNNYYSQGTEIYYAGQNMSLATYQSATGYDSNSYNLHPQWSDIYNGFLCNDMLDGIASSISYVTTDYSGYPRSVSQPDPGAVEFIGVNNFSLGGNDTLCGNSHTMEVSGATNSISWLVNGGGSSGSSVTIANTGSTPQVFNVTVVFTSATGCGSATDNALITLVPDAQLDSNIHLCADESELITAGGGSNATFQWSPTGEMTAGITVSEPGTYSVLKTELGCVSAATTVVTKSDAVQISDLEVCDEDLPLIVDATINNGLNYAWNGGNTPTSAINSFDATGNYSVTATDAFGCSSSSDFFLEVIDVPNGVISETHYANLYLFSSANSSNVGSNATYAWNFGDGGVSTDANPQHLYAWSPVQQTFVVTLAITNDCGSDVVTVEVSPDPLGVEHAGGVKMNVFPVPAKDIVNVQPDHSITEGSLELIDLTGRSLMKHNFNGSGVISLNLEGIASGNYLIRLTSEKGTSFAKVIIE